MQFQNLKRIEKKKSLTIRRLCVQRKIRSAAASEIQAYNRYIFR